MQAVADADVKQLGLVFTTLPPGNLEVSKAVDGSWASNIGFTGGEEVLEFNGIAPADMTEEKFKQIILQRPLTIKFRQAEAPPPPSPRAPSYRDVQQQADKLEEEVNNLMNMPGSYKYVGGMVAMVRSSLKAAGMKKYGIKWTKIFYDQDNHGSGRISWNQFHTLCREMLGLKEPDVQLRMVFKSMNEDRDKDVMLDDLIAFLSDPQERMRTKFKEAISRLTAERWYEILEERPIAWDFYPFLEMCRDNLGIRDPDVHIWLVFRALAGNDSSPVSPDQIRTFVSENGKTPSRPSITVKSKAQRRQSSRSIRQQVMAKANSMHEEEEAEGARSRAGSVSSRRSIKSTGSQEEKEVRLEPTAFEAGITKKEITSMLEKMKLYEVMFPEGIEPTTIGHLDQNIMKPGNKGFAWLGLTGDDWVVVSTRERGDPEYFEATDLTEVKAGCRIVFMHRPSAQARGYSTYAGDQSRSREIVNRMQPNSNLMEKITICRTNHISKSRGGHGRVSIAFDNSYVVLPGAKLLERDGDEVVFGYPPMDRIVSNCGRVTDSRESPELDFFQFADELVGNGSRLGPKKGKIEGLNLHEQHGLNVIGLGRKTGSNWDLQWCPTLDFFAISGDICITTRRREFDRPALPGLVFIASVAGSESW